MFSEAARWCQPASGRSGYERISTGARKEHSKRLWFLFGLKKLPARVAAMKVTETLYHHMVSFPSSVACCSSSTDSPCSLVSPRLSRSTPFALGFIAMLICGIVPRMIAGFSDQQIASAGLVSATHWLDNAAALLRVGSLLLAPVLAPFGGGTLIDSIAFGLSGPLGLALAICLLINLWPALSISPR